MSFPLEKIVRSTVIFCVLILFVGFSYLAFTGYLSDSEIWAVTLAKNLSEEWHNSWLFTRPLFYLPLGISSWGLNKAAYIFLSAKITMLLNATLLLYFTYRLARTLSPPGSGPLSGAIPWLVIFYLLSNTGFLNQGYRIRSDLFSATFTLLALYKTLERPAKHTLRISFFWLIPLLCTPKAFVHIAPAVTLLRPRRARNLTITVALAVASLASLAYPEGLRYLSSTYLNPELPLPFFSHERFVYVERVFSQNQIWVGLLLARTLTFFGRNSYSAFSNDESKLRHQMFAAFSGASFLFMILYPEKVPFFIAAYLPIACVNAALLFDDIFAIIPVKVDFVRLKFFQNAVWISLLISSLSIAHNASRSWLFFREENNDESQLRAINALEKLLNDFPRADYFDVVGLVPQRATLRYFAGPNDPQMNYNTMQMVSAARPNLFFYVRKAYYLEPEIGSLLRSSYFEISNRIFARWDKPEKPILLRAQNKKEIEEFLNRISVAVGRPGLSRFSLLVQTGKSPPQKIEMDRAEIITPAKRRKTSVLIAASPFTSLRERPGFLPSLIRFDWE